MTNAQVLRKIISNLQMGETFDKDARHAVLTLLLDLTGRVEKLERLLPQKSREKPADKD